MCNAQMNIEQGKCVNGCIMRRAKNTQYIQTLSLLQKIPNNTEFSGYLKCNMKKCKYVSRVKA